MDEINVGDVFLIRTRYIKDSGITRPVKVVDKSRYVVLCETLPMKNGQILPGVPSMTIPYRISFQPNELTKKLNPKQVKEWQKRNIVDMIFPDERMRASGTI